MKILLVEDEEEIRSFVLDGLSGQDWAVDCAETGDEGAKMAANGNYDAIVLDLMLPGQDGLSILKGLREAQNNVPVIVITARGEAEDRIAGLNLGADDYLAKPFYMDELIARLKAVWRRSVGEGLSVLVVEDLSANMMTREAKRGERSIDLTPREFSLLVYLMRSPGRVLTRAQILEKVWDYQFDPGTNIIDVYIRRLRTKIDEGEDKPLIETLRGVGYRIGASDAEAEES